MGSTEDALHEGSRHANPATASSTKDTPTISHGSCALFSTQREMTLFKPRLSTSPASNPEPTLTPADAVTFHNTSFFLAPSAMRMPNSLVRCTTEYETTLYKPTAANTSASTENAPNRIDTSRPLATSGSFRIQTSRSFRIQTSRSSTCPFAC